MICCGYMDYALAKELKDNGFPQGHPVNHHLGGIWITDDEDTTYHENGLKGECYIPTLSELIEECGTNFETLVHYEDSTWRAYRRDGAEDLQNVPSSTPEEAVAMLWLVLNKK